MTNGRPHENWARALIEALELPQPAWHSERTIAAGGVRIDELVDLTSGEPPRALGPLGQQLRGYVVAFEFYSQPLSRQDIKKSLGKLYLLATARAMRSHRRVAMVCLGVNFPGLVDDFLIPSFERALWSDGAWRRRSMPSPLQFWVLDVERLPSDEEGTSVWRLFTHVRRLTWERVSAVLEDPAMPFDEALRLEEAIMQRAEEQGLSDVVWRGVEFHREEGRAEGRAEGLAQGRAEGFAQGRAEGRKEGRAEGRAEMLALAEAVLPASDVEALRAIGDLRLLRQALAAALRRQRNG